MCSQPPPDQKGSNNPQDRRNIEADTGPQDVNVKPQINPGPEHDIQPRQEDHKQPPEDNTAQGSKHTHKDDHPDSPLTCHDTPSLHKKT